MAYSESLADRIREKLCDLPNIEEKEMMGGLTFMYNGKMCVGIIKDELMCRIDPATHEAAVEMQGCRTMDFTKRPMIGYMLVEENAIRKQQDLDFWINQALDFNSRAKSSKRKKVRTSNPQCGNIHHTVRIKIESHK
jgi:TfoX/Sxy family transcriptional regulator of competence genes